MPTFYLKRNDLLPAIVATLKDADGEPVSLTTASSVKFIMRLPNGAAKVDAAATVTAAATGVVTYTWAAGDTSLGGVFQAEFEVLWASGKRQTFPNNEIEANRLWVEIADDYS